MKNMQNKLTITQVVQQLLDNEFCVSTATIRNWCVKYGIGIKIGSRWFLEKEIISQILTGKIWKKKFDTGNFADDTDFTYDDTKAEFSGESNDEKAR